MPRPFRTSHCLAVWTPSISSPNQTVPGAVIVIFFRHLSLSLKSQEQMGYVLRLTRRRGLCLTLTLGPVVVIIAVGSAIHTFRWQLNSASSGELHSSASGGTFINSLTNVFNPHRSRERSGEVDMGVALVRPTSRAGGHPRRCPVRR